MMASSHRESGVQTVGDVAWPSVRLGDVCEINPRRTPGLVRSDDAPTSFVPMASVDERSGTIRDPLERPFSAVRKGFTYFENGDVIFAKITPCMQNGKHAICHGLLDGFGFGSTEFHVLRPGPKITAQWVHYYVRRPEILNRAIHAFTGSAGQQRLPESFLHELQIPLPPLAMQQLIVCRITDQLSKIESARVAMNARLAAAESLPSAYFRAAFDGPEANGWKKQKISEFAKTCSGATPPRGNAAYYGGDIPWVKTGELRDGLIGAETTTEETVTPDALRNCSLPLLPPRTLLIAMYGQGQTRGRTGLLMREATTNQACFAILPSPEVFESELLQFWFRANYSRLRALTEGRGGNQPNLNGVLLRELEVALPPLADQRRIVADLKLRIGAAEVLAIQIRDELAAVEALPAALLRDAFDVSPAILMESETATAYPHQLPQGIFFKRGALASYIVQRLHKVKTFGRVHLEKNLFLTEAFVGIDLAGNYQRQAAGPLDSDFLYKLESLASKKHWFTKHARGAEGFFYRTGTDIAGRVSAAEKILGDQKQKMDTLLDWTAKMNTEQIEITATLFAAWNDRLIDHQPVTDDLVVEDVRERWHESKQRFTVERLRLALDWMRKHDFIPSGVGPRTVSKQMA